MHLMLDYLVELGSELLSAGCAAYRLEALLTQVAKEEGLTADVFAVPTGLFIAIRTPTGDAPAVSMVRVGQWQTNLERLAQLDALLNRVVDRSLSVSEARVELKRQPQSTWSAPAQLVAGAGACAGAAVGLGGGVSDFVLAAMGGLVMRAMLMRTQRQPDLRFLENFIGGAVAALVAWLATATWPSHSRDVLVLATIIPLLPGMALTTGLAELTFKNLVAGTARLMDAAMTLLALVFGIAAVVALEQWVGPVSAPAEPSTPASWGWRVLAVAVASVSFGVSLGLARRRLPVALASGGVVWVVQQLVASWAPWVAAFSAAVVLACASNAYARLTQRPSQLFLIPGLLLLVPGVFGLRSLDAILRGEYTQGATHAVDMLVQAGALVIGLLVANVLVPPRKIL